MMNLNERAWQMLEATEGKAEDLGISVHKFRCGTKLFDCGAAASGGVQAGLLMVQVGMAGLGSTWIEKKPTAGMPWMWISVLSDHPLEACYLSQAAHWAVDDGEFRAMGSGPGCLLNPNLGVGQALGYHEKSEKAVLILESPGLPGDESCRKLADLCEVDPENLTLMVAPTACLAGSVQIAARSLETGLHKLHQIGFDLRKVTSGMGSCPIAPPPGDNLTALGWTNDMVFLGASVCLFLRGTPEEKMKRLAEEMPSSRSPMYGKPFLQVLKEVGGFYQVDPGLFAPAEVTLMSLDSGAVFHAGTIDESGLAAVLKGNNYD